MKIKNVLFVQPMHEKKETKRKKQRMSINFPWGLAYIATILKSNGYNVTIIDGQALQYEKEKIVNEIDQHDFDIIGISAFSTQFNAVRFIADHIKNQRSTPVVVGGPLATYQPQLTLENTQTDICVIGEGEYAILDLLSNMDNLFQVKGIAFKHHGKIVKTANQDRYFDLDQLPIPDFSFFDMEKYLKQNNVFENRKTIKRAISFISSRGCPYSCHFCSKSSQNYRSMSPKKIYHMLSFLSDNFGLEDVSFGDELFLASKSRFRELGPLLKSLDIPWGSQARINIMDKEFLQMAKNAGCRGLGYGIESGSQKILTNMNKRINVEQIENIMIETMKLNIPVKVQLIFGYPGETEETVQETVDLFDKIDHPGRRFLLITPVPGSKLYDDCIASGQIIDETKYLCDIEKSFGKGKVHINFTQWADDELLERKKATEKTMKTNYYNKSYSRKFYYSFIKKIF